MAHLITLTNSETNEDMLFNLDTVVSIESSVSTSQGNSVITTRWGRTIVRESLKEIQEASSGDSTQVAPSID